jgi:hypothetical protein
MEAWAGVVATSGVDCKGFATVGRLMGKYFDARWRERRLVIVEVVMDLRWSMLRGPVNKAAW